jgi:DNA-nicking Smr family endonuclease
MTRRKRHLSAEEKAIWETIARQTKPLGPRAKTEQVPRTKARSEPKKTSPEVQSDPDPIASFNIGERVDHSRSNDLLPALGQKMNKAPVRMDSKSFGRLKRGKLKPEARIDLHGMTQAEAHPALIGFILRSVAEGRRLVLVITGKGRLRDEAPPLPVRHGVLRHNVPQWLRMAPVAAHVLQITQAHMRHGGDGAYYVYLRRAR